MSNFRWHMLTPTLWSIAHEEEVEVGNIAWPMLEECLRKGEAIYKGSDLGVPGYTINFAKAKEALDEMKPEERKPERSFFIQAFHAKYPELCELNTEKNYPAMCHMVFDEMVRLEENQSPEDKARRERQQKELAELAEAWKAQQAEQE